MYIVFRGLRDGVCGGKPDVKGLFTMFSGGFGDGEVEVAVWFEFCFVLTR